MGAPIAPKWIKSASSVANAKTLENTADGGYQEVDALSADVKAALTGASSPSAENPFATVAEAGGEDDKTVKASSSDTTPGFLDAKVDGASIEVSGDKLRVNPTFLATTSVAGLMSAADKIRLDALELAALTIASIESY